MGETLKTMSPFFSGMLVTSSSAPPFRAANGKVRWPQYFSNLVYLSVCKDMKHNTIGVNIFMLVLKWKPRLTSFYMIKYYLLSVLNIAVSTQRQQHSDIDRAAGSLSHDEDIHLISSLQHLLFSAMREKFDSLFSSNYVSMHHCFKWFLTRKRLFPRII